MEGLEPDDVRGVQRDPSLYVLLRPANTTGYVAFNYKVRELQDKRIRRAFAHAIHKKAIVDALYGGTGLVRLSSSRRRSGATTGTEGPRIQPG